MPHFEVTFVSTGFTDNREIVDEELTESFCGGYNDQSIKEGLFPPGIIGVVSARISEDDAQGDSDIKVFVSVTLTIQAGDKEAAESFEPPVDLLTKLSDAMSSDVDLDGEWEVSNVDETGMNIEAGRDYQYKLMVAGKQLLTGDASSASVIFAI